MEWVTLILALYGAGLATYLGIRELQKDKRHIEVYLDHQAWYENFKLTIVNTGHRRVTIVGAGVRIGYKSDKGKPQYEIRPLEAYVYDYDPDNPPKPGEEPNRIPVPFPLILEDGETVSLPLNDVFNSELAEQSIIGIAYARDAEGNIYTNDRQRIYNSKSDEFMDKPLPE